MRRWFRSATIVLIWILALSLALFASSYFLTFPRLLLRSQMLALTRHRGLILLHIAGGTVAIIVGLFQFIGRLRESHPAVHRAAGYAYLSAVFVAGCVGLALSPDTARFAADGANELTTFDLSFLGLSPSFLGYSAASRFSPSQFLLVEVAFGLLALTWLLTSGFAFMRAMQRRFDAHREWMIRSYSLTFAAVTVRLVGLPFLVLTRDPVVAITCTFWSWVLNLAVSEWVIRSERTSAADRPMLVRLTRS
jgi:hypothetical protein